MGLSIGAVPYFHVESFGVAMYDLCVRNGPTDRGGRRSGSGTFFKGQGQ